MAKLEKGFEDYFRIPVLLKAIGETSQQSVKKVYQLLSAQRQQIIIDERYEIPSSLHAKLLEKRQKNVPQTIHFRINQFTNEWGEFQVVYRCRFVVGVFDSKGDLAQQWNKAYKTCQQESRKLIGLIILSLQNCKIENIKAPYIIVPEKIQQSEIFAFLQPWFFTILPIMQEYIGYLISQLQKDDNGFIVFNKAEEKPQPRTLKKKKKGRCLKICGDFCLVLHLIKEAYNFYLEAEEILKKVDDYLWALGCSQGKLACFTADFQLEGKNKQQILQQTRQQCFNLAKRIKVPQLQTQNYFKILKIYTKIPQNFDNMARQFLVYVTANYSSSQKFSILTQLALLYKQAGMMRKYIYILYLASRISMELKPSLVGILLSQILKSSHIKQWPLINANVIKLLIDNGTDSQQGQLHLDLLESCCPILTQKDIEITIQALQRRNFKLLSLENSKIFDIISINCLESPLKPKLNKIGAESPIKASTQGFFMNWRKKEIIYQFQQNQTAKFELKIRNNMTFPIRCSIKLHFQGPFQFKFHSFYLQPRVNKISLIEKFNEVYSQTILRGIEVKIFNFTYLNPVKELTPLKIQVYEQYPDFDIKIPEIFKNQESSLFEFPLTLTRTKQYLDLARVKITISVYYSIEVGFQQTQFLVLSLLQQKYLVVAADYPYEKSQDPNVEIIRLQPFRAHKKHLKKIELKVDAIREQFSKYQISKIVSTNCHFERSIWCELISVTTPTETAFKIKDVNIIEDKFTLRIAVNKKENDLTPYKITEGQQTYILSDKTIVIIQKTLDKMVKNTENTDKPLLMSFEWRNLIRQKQYGTIAFEVPMEQKMFLSNKEIFFSIQNWNKKQHQQIQCPADLKINYTIKSTKDNLSHKIIIKPLNLPNIKKYIVNGKTKYKVKNEEQTINNSLSLKLFYQYEEQYLIGLHFDDQAYYWFPCQFKILK